MLTTNLFCCIHCGFLNYSLFADQLCKIMHGANQLAYVAHFIIVPAHRSHQLCVTNCLYSCLCCIKQ